MNIVNIEVEISEEKIEMLGKVLAHTFKLKPNRDGLFATRYQGNKSYKGLANMVLETVSDIINESEESLRKQLAENFDGSFS